MPTKIILTDRQLDWLRKHFKHTKNAELCETLGLSQSALHRLAREHGLTKSRQFMKRCQAATAAAAKASHLKNGTYPPKGHRIPRSEQFGFQPGVTPEQRLGKRRNRQRIEKAAASRAKTFRLEKARALFGLPRETKLRVIRTPQQKLNDRWYLKKRGYLIDEKDMVAYWTEETRRATRLEKAPKRYYKFKPLEGLYVTF